MRLLALLVAAVVATSGRAAAEPLRVGDAKGEAACAMTPGPQAPGTSLALVGIAFAIARLRRRAGLTSCS